jgi:hypothetical protein
VRAFDGSQQILDRELESEIERVAARAERRQRRHQQAQLVALTGRRREHDSRAQE